MIDHINTTGNIIQCSNSHIKSRYSVKKREVLKTIDLNLVNFIKFCLSPKFGSYQSVIKHLSHLLSYRIRYRHFQNSASLVFENVDITLGKRWEISTLLLARQASCARSVDIVCVVCVAYVAVLSALVYRCNTASVSRFTARYTLYTSSCTLIRDDYCRCYRRI